MAKELELGKRYTWKEVVAAYPDTWVRMKKCNFGWGNGIIDGILEGVYKDNEIEDIQIEVWNSTDDDVLERTAIGMGIGLIECLNAEMEVLDES